MRPARERPTALLNSGLHFPLAGKLGQPKVQGVGGTRNCDWWFTDEAVLIDTAGRYTTQDSNQETDAAAWRGFLASAEETPAAFAVERRDRHGQRGRSVIRKSAAARDAEADAIRSRVQELQESFGITVPIYVLVTKADLMAGFSEFFADLGKEERAQVWGFTVPAHFQYRFSGSAGAVFRRVRAAPANSA